MEGMKVLLLTVDAPPEIASVCETCVKIKIVKKFIEGMHMVFLTVDNPPETATVCETCTPRGARKSIEAVTMVLLSVQNHLILRPYAKPGKHVCVMRRRSHSHNAKNTRIGSRSNANESRAEGCRSTRTSAVRKAIEGMKVVVPTVDAPPEISSVCETCMVS